MCTHTHRLCLLPCWFCLRFINRKGKSVIYVYNLNSFNTTPRFSLFSGTETFSVERLSISDYGLGTDYQWAVNYNLNTGPLISGHQCVFSQCHGQFTVCDGSPTSWPVRRKERGTDLLASPQVSNLRKCSIIQRKWNKWTAPALGEDWSQQLGSEGWTIKKTKTNI